MKPIVAISVAALLRTQRARAWLAAKSGAEEILILGASPAAVNDLVRQLQVADKPASFGWHRLTFAQLAATIYAAAVRAATGLPARGLVLVI